MKGMSMKTSAIFIPRGIRRPDRQKQTNNILEAAKKGQGTAVHIAGAPEIATLANACAAHYVEESSVIQLSFDSFPKGLPPNDSLTGRDAVIARVSPASLANRSARIGTSDKYVEQFALGVMEDVVLVNHKSAMSSISMKDIHAMLTDEELPHGGDGARERKGKIHAYMTPMAEYPIFNTIAPEDKIGNIEQVPDINALLQRLRLRALTTYPLPLFGRMQ
jgi:hypothetical protein